MADEPLHLDSHRGMTAQKATDIRRVLAEVETHARELRERRAEIEAPAGVPRGVVAGGGRQGALCAQTVRRACRWKTQGIAISSRPSSMTSPGSPSRAEANDGCDPGVASKE